MELSKKIKRTLIVLSIILISISILICFADVVMAASIKDYEEQIDDNNSRIENIKKIKEQLHITAEMIREDSETDNGLSDILSAKWHEYNTFQENLKEENDRIAQEIENIKSKMIFIGYFTITHYDICPKCCGKPVNHPQYGITATGTKATPGRTIAVDPKKIPYGSQVIIGDDPNIYVAEDTGGALRGNNKIDICVSSDAEAYSKGTIRNVPVYIIKQ